MGVIDSLKRGWRAWLVIVTPIALSPLVVNSGTQSSKCAFMLGVCTVYWVTESLPLPVTSLLPLVMAPTLGVLTTDDACKVFFGNLSAMFIGAIFVGGAIEESNLHRRIALNILLRIGVQPKRLLFSIMLITGFLSMWIANTAATSMMAPIVQILLVKLTEAKREINNQEETQTEMIDLKSETEGIQKTMIDHNGRPRSQRDKDLKRTVKTFHLAICYSANVGGIGTLLGTPPNIVLANAVKEFVMDGDSPITYVSWMKFGIPVTVVTLTLAYIWLSMCLFGLKNTILCRDIADKDESLLLRKVLLKEYKSLGVMTFHEKVVLGHFIVLIILFFTRDPGFAPGFSSLFPPRYISDATGALGVSISLFVWPRSRPNVLCFRSSKDITRPKSQQSALSWKTASRSLRWGTLFLFGGGVVLAQATKSSGLDNDIGEYLTFVSHLPTWVTVLILTSLVCVVTEITSNTVIAIIILPILGNLALQLHVNPLQYMLPAAVATSMAFMLPVATPPNAIIYSMGEVKMMDMIKSGISMNVLGILSINVLLNSVAYYAFSLGEFPSWATPIYDVTGNATRATMNSTIYDRIENVTIATNDNILS